MSAIDVQPDRLRAPVQWFGGKGNMVAKLRTLVPPGGQPYCEPYCGAASLFFSRDPAPVEVLNDLDREMVNLYRCLQDRETFDELRHRLMWTPYARAELARAIGIRDSGEGTPVDRAWAFFVTQNMGMGGKPPKTSGDWGRTFTICRGMACAPNSWLMRLSMLDAWRWRLAGVHIDCRDAIEVVRYWDTPEAVFYLDPPYHHERRVNRDIYAVEPGHDHHLRLVETLLSVKGAAVLSGYAHPVYEPLVEAGWRRIDFETVCHAAARTRNSGLQGLGSARAKVKRIETVWINPQAQERIDG